MHNVTHLGFSDESNFRNRYPAIGLITGEYNSLIKFENIIGEILNKCYHRKMSWQKIDRIRGKFAKPMLYATAQILQRYNVRIDILTWDARDKHFGHYANRNIDLPEMYLALLRWVTKNGWADDAIWGIYPDQLQSIDWNDIKSNLSNVNFIQERDDGDVRLLQLVDFFAGITTFICNDISGYNDWNNFKYTNYRNQINIKSRIRYDLVDYFMSLSETYDWNIEITDKGMRSNTQDFDYPITIWTYSSII